MKEKTVYTRKKALLTVAVFALVILLLIFLRYNGGNEPDLMTTEGRQMFLSSLGWEIDPESEGYKSVLLPTSLEGIMEEYNRMQTEQGYDLSKHLGEECDQYSYIVTNYGNSEGAVYVTMYLQEGKLIAADIHSTAMDGFMHGIYKK